MNGTANNTNVVFGYNSSNPPLVLSPTPNPIFENITSIDIVQGGSGIVTGITTVVGTGGQGTLGIKFFLNAASNNEYSNFQNGYPIFISDTIVGRGVTSINNAQNVAVVGVGTTFVDNVYIVRNFSAAAANAEFVADILSTTASAQKFLQLDLSLVEDSPGVVSQALQEQVHQSLLVSLVLHSQVSVHIRLFKEEHSDIETLVLLETIWDKV